MRSVVISFLAFLALGTCVSCSEYRDFVGPGATVDLAVFLVDGATPEDEEAVQELLHVPGAGSEFGLVEGVQGVTAGIRVIYVDFSPDATAEQIARIEALLAADDIVDRLVRDYTIPSD